MKKKYLGITYIVISAFCFALMNMFVRLSGDLPSVQKSFFRNLVALVFAFAILKKDGAWFSGKRENIKYLLVRSAAGTIGILCNFYAVDRMVLSDASMLNKMSPFFVIIFSFFILKEKIKPSQILIVAGAFLGSLLIIKPTPSIFQTPAALIGLLGGLTAGLAYTYVRLLGERGEKGPFIVFIFSSFSCIVTLPFLLFEYHPMNLMQIVFLLLAGLCAAGGQFGITAAYFHAPAREISVYDYSQIIFSAILGFFVFGQIPDVLSWIGYGVICAMAVLMFLYNNRKQEGVS
ncbi:DMT family transporter [Faecalicatena sp. AGMB00832]|uniref:DMT family transporter n=1 Tax=Faecalicatena faecalis TaxID=2726362 RepID=A0ABS6D3Z9_9FIRM|nr:DMT family transporter [Faecalicatena faecalis]MBU3876218.1 DMT family transporter [Faecalicatena faecalis]